MGYPNAAEQTWQLHSKSLWSSHLVAHLWQAMGVQALSKDHPKIPALDRHRGAVHPLGIEECAGGTLEFAHLAWNNFLRSRAWTQGCPGTRKVASWAIVFSQHHRIQPVMKHNYITKRWLPTRFRFKKIKQHGANILIPVDPNAFSRRMLVMF